MATSITISTGAITSTRTFQNDTVARAALLRFYTAYNVGPADLSNQEKLDAVVDWFISQVISVSVQANISADRVTMNAQLEETARALYDFKREG